MRHTQSVLWRMLAILALALGAIGLVLPVLPTVPFLLLAAWAASHGWPRMEARLLEHPYFGPPIRQWRERGIVARRAKWLASAAMGASVLVVLLSAIAVWVKVAVALILACTAWWLWWRPER